MYWDNEITGGFNFDKYQRNQFLEKNNHMEMKYTKTGTTIIGLVFKDGIVLAADTRATSGSIISENDILKIHSLAPNIYTLGAGTAADCLHVCNQMKSELELQRLNTKRESRISHLESRLTDNYFAMEVILEQL